MNPGECYWFQCFWLVGAEKSDWHTLWSGPTDNFCLDGSAIRPLFDFGGAAKLLRSLGHQKPEPKSRALLTGVNAPIAALH
jgi:hypothetical protein